MRDFHSSRVDSLASAGGAAMFAAGSLSGDSRLLVDPGEEMTLSERIDGVRTVLE